jgi:hypothetical protein
MAVYAGEWFRNIKFSLRYSHPLARIPWSAIRRIGQSRLLKLTIIVPFLGSLLLFNERVVDLLTLSTDVVGRWLPVGIDDPKAEARGLTLTRLYYLYFGGTFLGIGSALFALLCPLDIKTYGSPREHIEAEGPLVTSARMGLMVTTIVQEFENWFDDEYPGYSKTVRTLGEPGDFESLFSQVITEVYVAIPDEQKPDDVGPKDDPEADFGGIYTDHRGRPHPRKIANSLYMGTTADQALAYQIQAIAIKEEYRRDFLTLQYLALDHSKPWARAIVTIFYCLGFFLLLLPTAFTFFRLLYKAVT